MPLYSHSFTDDYDKTSDIRPWTCMGPTDDSIYQDSTGDNQDIVIEGEGIINDDSDFSDSF